MPSTSIPTANIKPNITILDIDILKIANNANVSMKDIGIAKPTNNADLVPKEAKTTIITSAIAVKKPIQKSTMPFTCLNYLMKSQLQDFLQKDWPCFLILIYNFFNIINGLNKIEPFFLLLE